MRAREVALWATSDCDRVRALGASGASGRAAAAFYAGVDAYDHEVKASPFGTDAGFAHESRLLTNDAEAVRRLYREHLGIEVHPSRCRVVIPWGHVPSPEDEERARRETARHLTATIGGHEPQPMVLAQARLSVRIDDTDHEIKPDLLVWDGSVWHVGEMKAYIDLGGYTDATSIASAVRQAAVSVVALRQFAERAGLSATPVVVNRVGLLLRARLGGGASLRLLDSSAEVQAIEAAIGYAGRDRARYLAMTGGRPLDSPESLRQVPMRFTAHCREACGLAPTCEAEQGGDLAARLGRGVDELSQVGISPARAIALAEGASPATAAERRAAYALGAAWRSAG